MANEAEVKACKPIMCHLGLHKWGDIPSPDTSHICTKDLIRILITGQICSRCGSVRVYNGPMYGWSKLR